MLISMGYSIMHLQITIIIIIIIIIIILGPYQGAFKQGLEMMHVHRYVVCIAKHYSWTILCP